MVTINIKMQLGEDSIYNLAFIKALLIKYNIEELNISYNKKVEIKKLVLKELQRLENT